MLAGPLKKTIIQSIGYLLFATMLFAAEPTPRELDLELQLNRSMQQAARVDMDRGELLKINAQMRLESLGVMETNILERIKKAKETETSKGEMK